MCTGLCLSISACEVSTECAFKAVWYSTVCNKKLEATDGAQSKGVCNWVPAYHGIPEVQGDHGTKSLMCLPFLSRILWQKEGRIFIVKIKQQSI